MAKSNLKLIGFDKLKDILDPKKFEKRLKKHVGKATLKNGLLAEGRIKSQINKGKIKSSGRGKKSGSRNAQLTIAMKGSDRPLVDSGELMKSISSEVKSWDLVHVGVLRNRTVVDEKTDKKTGVMLIAKSLHDGAILNVTDKMRRFFFWMAFHDDSPFKGIVKPLKPGTKKIIIPPRPFLFAALAPVMIKRYTKNWNKAVMKVMQGKN
jgi:hypothetical protein